MLAQVIQNDVSLPVCSYAPIQQFQERKKGLAVRTIRHFPNDLSRQRIECGIETGCTVSLVVVRTAADPTRIQWQPRLGAVQRLDLGLLIHTEHNNVLWWVHVQTHYNDNLVRELWIIADLECLQSVRPKICRFPDLSNLPGRNACVLGHQLNTPVCCFLGNTLGCQKQHLIDRYLVDDRRASTAGAFQQPVNTFRLKAISPAMYRLSQSALRTRNL